MLPGVSPRPRKGTLGMSASTRKMEAYASSGGVSMGLRFHKSVSLAKGIRVNLSKSGPSLSLGPKGATLNISKRGVYASAGLPGTGLSYRTKLGGSKRSSKSSGASRTRSVGSGSARSVAATRPRLSPALESHLRSDGTLPLALDLDENGEITYTLEDTGEQVTDKALIREIRKVPGVEEELAALEEEQQRVWAEMREESEETSREFIDIYKLAPQVLTADELSQHLSRAAFTTGEQGRLALEAALSTDDEVMADLVEEWLSNLEIPATVSAQIGCESGHLYLDLDLPEIEDLPQTTTKQLASGQVKVVDKTQKQLKEEYANCVLGLAFFMAANIFDLNANIVEVTVSGYTQRRNKNGDMTDDYIYSARFPREQLRATTVSNPIEDINAFESRLKLGPTFSFGSINPY